MSRVEQLGQQIAELDTAELQAFRAWFARNDAEIWDQQIERHAGGGKFANLDERALLEHNAGHSTEL